MILTKFVCCADSDLLYISKLRPYITAWHCMPTTHNANRAVRNIALLHKTALRGALGVDHVLTKHVYVAEPANRTNNNKSLRSTVVKVKTTPTFQPTDSRLSSGQMATRAGEH